MIQSVMYIEFQRNCKNEIRNDTLKQKKTFFFITIYLMPTPPIFRKITKNYLMPI
jgi:hypothetical protein